MKVYPQIVVFCPKTKQEENGQKCLSCEFYNKHKVEAKRLFIDCKLDE